jgi:LDH2 family malate/lactate/ureidoglycolate dehydrogenase
VARFPVSVIRQQAAAILRAWGMAEPAAERTAAIMVDADLRGIDSHGISMLPGYATKLAAGGLRIDATAEVVHDDGRAVAVIDAHDGLGHLAAERAMDIACERARGFGVGLAVVRSSHHFGAAGYYARLAARRGLVGIVTTSAATMTQAPTGGVERRLGTNPIAFAAPAASGAPFVLDMSTTVVAVNKVKTYALSGAPLPADWVADGTGRPVRASDEALRLLRDSVDGGLVPLGGPGTLAGGHKGYGLAMMVQILSCGLSGAGLPGGRSPDGVGHAMLAIDPAAFGADVDTPQYVSDLVDLMHATTPLDPSAAVLVAGEPEERARAERARAGVRLPPMLLDQLRAICDTHGAPFLLRDATDGAAS